MRLCRVAGATLPSHWCDFAESLVQLCRVAGATLPSRWCNFYMMPTSPGTGVSRQERTLGRDLCERARSLYLCVSTPLNQPPSFRMPDFAPKTPLNRTHGTPSAPRVNPFAPERSSRGRKDGQCALTWLSATLASAMGQAASAIGLGRTSWWRWTYLLMAKVVPFDGEVPTFSPSKGRYFTTKR